MNLDVCNTTYTSFAILTKYLTGITLVTEGVWLAFKFSLRMKTEKQCFFRKIDSKSLASFCTGLLDKTFYLCAVTVIDILLLQSKSLATRKVALKVAFNGTREKDIRSGFGSMAGR